MICHAKLLLKLPAAAGELTCVINASSAAAGEALRM